jgi:hypothetical protein
MRRLYAWIAGAAGGLTAYRLLARRRGRQSEMPAQAPVEGEVRPEPSGPEGEAEAEAGPEQAESEPALQEGPDPRAGELRERLSESRGELSAEGEVEPTPEDPDERRRRVHEQGRAAVDEMRAEEPGAEHS